MSRNRIYLFLLDFGGNKYNDFDNFTMILFIINKLLFNKLITLLPITKIIPCTFQFNKNSIINNK